MFNRLFRPKKEVLDTFFNPQSIAIVGASENREKIGGFIYSNLLDLRHISLFPINNKNSFIFGKKSYSSISVLPKPVDLVIVVIPAQYVIETIKEAAEKGCKNFVIISAGFKEVGNEGKQREKDLKQLIENYGLHIIGPNCLGIINPHLQLNCSFAKDIPCPGKTALISQSGAVIDALIDWGLKENVGFSKIVSLGNMAGVDELDALQYLAKDKDTHSIIFYMETLEKGQEFAKVLEETSFNKPVIIIKPGNSENAKKAIGSHTGSLAQNNLLVQTLIKDHLGIYLESFDELYSLLKTLDNPFPSSSKTYIITNAGGPGVIATDAIDSSSLKLEETNQVLKEALSKKLPKEASLHNPIDIIGDARSQRYTDTLDILLEDQEEKNILVLLTPQVMTDNDTIAKALVDRSKKTKTPIYSSFLGGKEIEFAQKHFIKENFPNFQTPEQAIKTLDTLYKYQRNKNQEHTYKQYQLDQQKIAQVREKLKDQKGLASFELTKEIFSCFAISLPEKYIIRHIEDIDNLPSFDESKLYVLKADGILHKKELDAVRTGVKKEDLKIKAKELFNRLKNEKGFNALTIEEEVKGIETIVGLTRDNNLGDFLLFGAGGTFVSVIKDSNFSTCPLSEEKASQLISGSKIFPLLNGYRGSKAVNIEKLKELLIRISQLPNVFPEIKELDINPLICNENGLYLVDVKIIL